MYAIKLLNTKNFTKAEIEKIFKKYGNVSVFLDKDVVFVRFNTVEEAAAALRGIDGHFQNLETNSSHDNATGFNPGMSGRNSRNVEVDDKPPPLVDEHKSFYSSDKVLILANIPDKITILELSNFVHYKCGVTPIFISDKEKTEECGVCYCFLEFNCRENMIKCKMCLNSHVYKGHTLLTIEPTEAIGAFKSCNAVGN